MTKIIQWNCKGLRARHEEFQLLMNRYQPSCIFLQDVMLENDKYSLGKEYEYYGIEELIKLAKKYDKMKKIK